MENDVTSMIVPILDGLRGRAAKTVAYRAGLTYLDEFPEHLKSVFAIDTETTGLNPRRDGVVGISLSDTTDRGFAYEVKNMTSDNIETLQRGWRAPAVLTAEEQSNNAVREAETILGVNEQSTDPALCETLHIADDQSGLVAPGREGSVALPGSYLIAHNWQFDGPALRQLGIDRDCDFDTMVAAYVLRHKRVGLKPLGSGILDIDMQGIDDLIQGGKYTMEDIPWPLAVPYACADADVTLQLYNIFRPQIEADPKLKTIFDMEMRLLPYLIRMTDNGVKVDGQYLKNMEGEIETERFSILSQIRNLIGDPAFNPDSPAKLSKLLFEEIGLEPIKSTDTPGQYATGKDVLEELRHEHPVIDLVQRYRELRTLVRTFVSKLPGILEADSRMRTNWRQTVVVTGRLSSSPNLQNIPVRTSIGDRIRAAFIPDIGNCFVGADYSNLEVRVLAHLSQDQNLIDIICADEDVHILTACMAFGLKKDEIDWNKEGKPLRDAGKVTFFATGYGAMENKIAQLFRPIISRSQARELSDRTPYRNSDPYINAAKATIEGIYLAYPRLKVWKQENIRACAERGYAESLLGRRAYVDNLLSSSSKARAQDERFVCNMPVQSTASGDIMKLAMLGIWDILKDESWWKPWGQIHDELQNEVPIEKAGEMKYILEAIMPNVIQLDVPLKVDVKIGASWAETH